MAKKSNSVSAKKHLVKQMKNAMKEQGITKAELARMVKTSWAQIDKVLNPDVTSTRIQTLAKVGMALGLKLTIVLIDGSPDDQMAA